MEGLKVEGGREFRSGEGEDRNKGGQPLSYAVAFKDGIKTKKIENPELKSVLGNIVKLMHTKYRCKRNARRSYVESCTKVRTT